MKMISKVLTGILFVTACLLQAGEKLVAQPYRAIDNPGWPITIVSGRNYWQFMSFDLERMMPGIKDIDFYKNGGRFVYRSAGQSNMPIIKENLIIRTIAIRQIRILTTGGKNLAPETKFNVIKNNEISDFRNVNALNDNDQWTTFSARGRRENATTRFLPVSVIIDGKFSDPGDVSKIVILDGAFQDAGLINKVKLSANINGKWTDIPYKQTRPGKRTLEISLNKPVKTTALRFECKSYPVLFSFHEEYLPDAEHLKTHAFYIKSPIRANRGDVFCLTKHNFDKKSFEKFLDDYKNTFWGFDIPEWDSNMKQILRKSNQFYAQVPEDIKGYKTKDQALVAFRKFFNLSKHLLYDDVLVHSGGISTVQYGPAFGAKTTLLQTSGILNALPVRSMLMALRGGARQFGNIPWIHYQSCIWGGEHPMAGTHYGKAACQLRREMITSYYMGANGQQLEGDRYGMLDYNEKGKLKLAVRGKIYQDMYRWNKSGKGERGESYTPFLFLADYNHGHTGRHGWGGPGEFKTWNKLEFDDGDYMHEHFMRTVDKYLRVTGNYEYYDLISPYSPNIRNSKIGDICDLFFANPPQHGGVIKKEHIEKYPVVFLLGIINFNVKLVKRLKEYVKNGGTLVVNAAQCNGLFADPDFLGLEVGKDKVRSQVFWKHNEIPGKFYPRRGYIRIMKVKLEGAKAVKIDKRTKLPLLTKFKYGKGNVLVTTPYFMLLDEKKKANPLIEELLVDIQKEVLPVQVAGDVQFLMNKITPAHWKVVLNNNKGIIKPPNGKVTYDLRYAATVTLTAPGKNVQAREILNEDKLSITRSKGNTIINIKVNPGEAKVIDIKGINKL